MCVSLCHKNVWLESKVFSLICSLRTTVIPTKSERKCSIKLFACLKIYGQNMTQKAVDSELRVRHTANGSEQWLQSFRTDRRNRKRISNPFVAVIYHWIVSNSNLFRHDLCSKKNDTRIVFGICWAFGRSGRTKHLKNSCIRVNYCSEKLLHSLSLPSKSELIPSEERKRLLNRFTSITNLFSISAFESELWADNWRTDNTFNTLAVDWMHGTYGLIGAPESEIVCQPFS